MKKLLTVLVIISFILTPLVYAKSRLEKGVNNIYYSATGGYDNLNTEGCTDKQDEPRLTKQGQKGFGRLISKLIGGTFQVATFWYPESDSNCKPVGSKSVK